ncbi:UDP-glucuronosyltransferase 1-2-like, partial [Photinus pyralis]|uniref:UDP-glucuronosyltransferase 1-2-like n=1 Tax=Photinus pyralis TaxID=7054 RepID=UPI0012677DF2
VYRTLGNPTHSSLYPDNILPFGDKLSLWQRVASFVFEYGIVAYLGDLVQNDQKIVAKHFGDDYPPLGEIANNISMLFVNADPIFHHNRPLVPTVVQIGSGSHRSTPRPLPKKLQSTLDHASDGFIYFSLGSNMKSEFLPANTMEVLLSVFAELPYTVLWKFGEEIANKSDNVIVAKWLPQEDVLRHPNCKLFITQCGLQSMDEAIYSHVPMVGMPVFGDQFFNAKKIVNKGLGLELDYQRLEREHFKKTVLEVITNPRYRSTVKQLAELAQDQPMTGTEKAVWWTEYVIRHKGARHLRSPLLDIPWYQYLLLDVIGVLLFGVSVTLYSMVVFVRWLIRLIRRRFYAISVKKKSS